MIIYIDKFVKRKFKPFVSKFTYYNLIYNKKSKKYKELY